MSDQPGHERPGDTVPHQEEIEEVVEAAVEGSLDDDSAQNVADVLAAASDHVAIVDVTATAINDAASPGVIYDQTEAVALRTELVALNARLALVVASHNEVLDVLRDADLIPTEEEE